MKKTLVSSEMLAPLQSVTSKYTVLFYLCAEVAVAMTLSNHNESHKFNRKDTRDEQKEKIEV